MSSITEAIRASMAPDPVVEQAAEQLAADWDLWRTAEGCSAWRPPVADVARSVALWHAEGFPVDLLVDLVSIPMTAAVKPGGEWSYFCGCVWRKIREAQGVAS